MALRFPDPLPGRLDALEVDRTLAAVEKLLARRHKLVARQVATGTVHLRAARAPSARRYEWQVSADGAKWSSAPSTRQPTTTLTDLPPDVTWFRERAVIGFRGRPWCIVRLEEPNPV